MLEAAWWVGTWTMVMLAVGIVMLS